MGARVLFTGFLLLVQIAAVSKAEHGGTEEEAAPPSAPGVAEGENQTEEPSKEQEPSSPEEAKKKSVRNAITNNMESIKNLGKKGEDGKYLISDAEVARLKESLAGPLGLDPSKMGISPNPKDKSGLIGGSLLIREKGSKKVVIVGQDGSSVAIDQPWSLGIYTDSKGNEQLLSISYVSGAAGDPWRANVGTQPGSLYMQAPGENFRTSFSVRGEHTLIDSFFRDAQGNSIRLGRSRGGGIDDVGGSKFIELN